MCHIVPQLLQTVSRVDVEDEGSLAGGQVEGLHGHCKGPYLGLGLWTII